MQEKLVVTVDEGTLRFRVERVLQIGFRVAAVLLGTGLALTLARQQEWPDTLGSPRAIVEGLADGHGSSIVGLGILSIILTPLVATLVIAWSFYQEGDRRYAGISLLVLAILIGSLVVSAL